MIRCYEENDILGFQKALRDYQLYMKTVADEIYEFLTKECNVKNYKRANSKREPKG